MFMIPKLAPEQLLDTTVVSFCQSLKAAGFAGDIETSYGSRLAVATDNSVYQQLPQAVILPKHQADIVLFTELASTTKYAVLKFAPRGGGTGTNGQALTQHIVVDLSRHMRGILEFNAEQRWVRVEAGVIKDQLNAFLKPFGFFFAPDLSTSNRATIGGMINTDASGQGSLVYGKTSDHVLKLTTVLADGTILNTSAISRQNAEEKAQTDSVEGRIYQQALATCTEFRAANFRKISSVKSVFNRL